MALMAEELVQEWLNRQGFFTIRNVRVRGHELDLLAVKRVADGTVCRHVEVNACVGPINYISGLPKSVQKATGRGSSSAGRRVDAVLREGVREWVEKKYRPPRVREVRDALWPGAWSEELVVNEVKYPEELLVIEAEGVKVHRLGDVIANLTQPVAPPWRAAGSDLADLLACASAPPRGSR